MERRIIDLKNEKKYNEVLRLASSLTPDACTNSEVAHAVGKAYEKKNGFSQCIPWYIRSFELNPSDEALGMIIGVCLAIGNCDKAEEVLNKVGDDSDGYYYRAGRYQLALRKNAGADAEIEALEAFLDFQEEESYMLRLATLYAQNDQEREAGRLCKKMGRLFISGKSVDYAEELQKAIKEGNGTAYIQNHPWHDDYVFKHLSFDPAAPLLKDETVSVPEEVPAPAAPVTAPAVAPAAAPEAPKKDRSFIPKLLQELGGGKSAESKAAPAAPKKETNKISPIVEKCLEGVVGMQELKTSLNDIFNMMQISKKRVGFAPILKDNIRIYGPDGCGKTTAAMAAAKALAGIGITGVSEPKVTDYFSLVGATAEETHDNIQELFEGAENCCIVIENIHEFDDSGAYSHGLDAIDQLLKAYMTAEENIPLIITGSEKEVEALLAKKRKFGELFKLPSVVLGKYSTEELVQIAYKMADDRSFILDEGVHDLLFKRFDHMSKQPDFKYSRDLENMINEAYIQQATRLSRMRRPSENDYYVIKAEDFGSGETVETVEELLQELEKLTGLQEVKRQVNKIVNQVTVQKMREEAGFSSGQGHGSLHLVFLGNAGTGKTTVARILGKIYKRLGVLPSGQLIECTRRDLVSQYVGATATKVAEKVKEAMGGILFIDEAYTLCKDDNDSFGREAIDALLTDIENHRDNLMVILAGYADDMSKFMDQNQGLRSRIPTDILFEDYSSEEMVEIFKRNVKNRNLILDVGLEQELYTLIDTKKKMKNFGNARGVRNLFEEILLNMDNRLGSMDRDSISKNDFYIIRKEDFPAVEEKGASQKSVKQYLDDLNALTGLAAVKDKVNKIVSTVEVNRAMAAAGLSTQAFGTLHMVFKGNAGTGKTTVARLIGGIYKELGVLSSGHLVECDRSALVGQYIGSTAPKVKAKVQEALGGILFIDEAYALAKGGENDYGKEAIDTLVADIENYRKDLMVIIAGYSDDMDIFLRQNQGLSSRFPNEIIFEDYTPEELLSIFKSNIASRGLIMDSALEPLALQLIAKHSSKADFGNARGVRNLVDKISEQRNVRIARLFTPGHTPTKEELQTVIQEDLEYFL